MIHLPFSALLLFSISQLALQLAVETIKRFKAVLLATCVLAMVVLATLALALQPIASSNQSPNYHQQTSLELSKAEATTLFSIWESIKQIQPNSAELQHNPVILETE